MKKVYLETFGCQMNVSDSERVSTLLENKGFELTSAEDSADIVLFNTCSVREKAEQKLYTRVGQIRNSKREKPIVGVLGCVAQLEGETLFNKIEGVDFVLGTKAVGRVHEIIEKVYQKNKKFIDLGEREADYDWTVSETRRISQNIAFVPIIEGCNKFCTYCIVPFSRGREKSLLATEIIRQVLELRTKGIKEVHLIGQNVNSYRPIVNTGLEQFKGATPFSKLLRAVAATGIERIKFNTSFPRDFHPDIVKAINENENLCNWVHLPVQSGSDNVLRNMRRGHTVDSYKRKIDVIRNSPRNISLTTDIIVGFPGETERDFQDSIDLFHYCQYDSAYVFKYSVRTGTPASMLPDDVLTEDKTRRYTQLDLLQRSLMSKALERQVGRTFKVLVERPSSKNDNELMGHTDCHKVVNFKGNASLIGSIVNILVTESKSISLYGIL